MPSAISQYRLLSLAERPAPLTPVGVGFQGYGLGARQTTSSSQGARLRNVQWTWQACAVLAKDCDRTLTSALLLLQHLEPFC